MDEQPPTTTPARGITRRQRRIVDAAVALTADPWASDDDRAYLARPLVQATLPHRDPGDVPEWSRRNGRLTLAIQPGYATHPKTGDRYCVGYPYGSLPRLLLFWINTEAVTTKSRRLELGDTLAKFLRELGLDDTRGGRCSDARRLQNQMRRLFKSRISFDYTGQQDGREGEGWLQMPVTSRGHLWWDETQPNQAHLWGSWIELGEDFYRAITAAGSAVPLDFRVLRALKQSPMALDLYAWLLHRTFSIESKGKNAEPQFVPWRALQQQVGSDYDRLDHFVTKAKKALQEVEIAMMGTRLLWTTEARGGLMVHPSGPPLLDKARPPTGT